MVVLFCCLDCVFVYLCGLVLVTVVCLFGTVCVCDLLGVSFSVVL